MRHVIRTPQDKSTKTFINQIWKMKVFQRCSGICYYSFHYWPHFQLLLILLMLFVWLTELKLMQINCIWHSHDIDKQRSSGLSFSRKAPLMPAPLMGSNNYIKLLQWPLLQYWGEHCPPTMSGTVLWCTVLSALFYSYIKNQCSTLSSNAPLKGHNEGGSRKERKRRRENEESEGGRDIHVPSCWGLHTCEMET